MMAERIYLAARFSRNDEMRGVRDVLTAIGYEITSRWIDLHGGEQKESAAAAVLNSDPASVAHFGEHDIEDLRAADVVVSFTSPDNVGKGGRHIEFGYGLALGKRMVVVGPRENIFHTLPQVEHYPDWPRLVMALAGERQSPSGVGAA
jgi:nucleoside 2-deoxyribosyltransferase